MSNILFYSTGDKSNEQNNIIGESNSNNVEETVTQSPLVVKSDNIEAQRKIFVSLILWHRWRDGWKVWKCHLPREMFKNHFDQARNTNLKKHKNTVITGLVKENTCQNASFIALKMMVSNVSSALCFWPHIGKDHLVILLTKDTGNGSMSKKKNLV